MRARISFFKHCSRIRVTQSYDQLVYKLSRHGLFTAKLGLLFKRFTCTHRPLKSCLLVHSSSVFFFKKNKITVEELSQAHDILDCAGNTLLRQLVFQVLLNKKQCGITSMLGLVCRQARLRFVAYNHALRCFKIYYKCLKMSVRRSRRHMTVLGGTLPKKPKERLDKRIKRFLMRRMLLRLRHKHYLWRRLKGTRKFPRFAHQPHYYHKKTLAVGMLAARLFIKFGSTDFSRSLNQNKMVGTLFNTIDVYFRFTDFNYFMPTLFFDLLVSTVGSANLTSYFVSSLSRYALCVGTQFAFFEYLVIDKRRQRFVIKHTARLTNVIGAQY